MHLCRRVQRGLSQARGSCRCDPAGQISADDGLLQVGPAALGEAMKGKEYVRPVGANWWLLKRSYTLFMLRELTAVFVGGYAIFLVILLYRAGQGPEAFASFAEELKSPVSIALHLIALAMALYHTIT